MEKRTPYRSQGPGTSSTKALLEKASAQLRGERFQSFATESKDNEVDEYLSTLAKKPSSEPRWDRFGEMDDLIIEDGVSAPPKVSAVTGKGSMFLKKPVQSSQDQSETKGLKDSHRATSFGTAPRTGPSVSDKVGEVVKKFAQKAEDPGSTGHKSGSTRIPFSQLSDSDLDLSLDEEVLRDVERRNKKPLVKPNDDAATYQSGQASRSTKPVTSGDRSRSQLDLSTDEASISSPTQVGRYPASQFLKKQSSPEIDMKPVAPASQVKKGSPKGERKSEQISTKPSIRNISRPPLDTDDESLAEYIEGLSSASSVSAIRSPRKKSKSPVRSPRKATNLMQTSPDREIIHYEESISEAESENFKINVQELDALDYIEDDDSSPSHSRVSPTKSTPFKVQYNNNRSSPERANKVKDTKSYDKVKNKDRGDSILDKFGIRSVDEIMDEEDSDEMRIPEALDESDYDLGPQSRAVVSPKPALRSILSPTPRSITPRSSRSRVRLMDELIEVRSRSPSPEPIQTGRRSRGSRVRGRSSSVSSEVIAEERQSSRRESDSAIQTVWESETDAASSVRSDSESESSRRSGHGRARRRSSGASSAYSYSDDFTGDQSTRDSSPISESHGRDSSPVSDSQSLSQQWTNSYTDEDARSDVSLPVSPSRRRREKMKDISIQTGLDTGLQYHWLTPVESEVLAGAQYGQSFVDPSSIAATVVSADALEAMTAYSPATLALNDMLRMQLDLTKQFMTTQKRLYQSLMQSIDTTFQYTTLQDTKEYIRRHRKPRSSYSKILKEVKEEMGIA